MYWNWLAFIDSRLKNNENIHGNMALLLAALSYRVADLSNGNVSFN